MPVFLTLFCLLFVTHTLSAKPVSVVASFSILEDWITEVGGAHVTVKSLVPAGSDAHMFEPRPADVRLVASADLVIVNGLGFESWLDRLVSAGGSADKLVVASTGVRTIPEVLTTAAPMRVVDPHAWHDVGNAIVYVTNIARALCRVDPEQCPDYQQNAARYQSVLRSLDAEIRKNLSQLGTSAYTMVTSHDSYAYFARAYNLRLLSVVGLSTEARASARDVARLVDQIRASSAIAIFLESTSDPRLIEQIARETGARQGGELFADALSSPDGAAPTYIALIRHNARTVMAALGVDSGN